MRKPELKEYIQKRLAEKEDALIAKQDEVLRTLTRILRRLETESVVTVCKKRRSHYDKQGRKVTDDIEEPVIVHIPAKISDVNKAAEMLGKYYGLLEKQSGDDDKGEGGVIILPEVEIEGVADE